MVSSTHAQVPIDATVECSSCSLAHVGCNPKVEKGLNIVAIADDDAVTKPVFFTEDVVNKVPSCLMMMG